MTNITELKALFLKQFTCDLIDLFNKDKKESSQSNGELIDYFVDLNKAELKYFNQAIFTLYSNKSSIDSNSKFDIALKNKDRFLTIIEIQDVIDFFYNLLGQDINGNDSYKFEYQEKQIILIWRIDQINVKLEYFDINFRTPEFAILIENFNVLLN